MDGREAAAGRGRPVVVLPGRIVLPGQRRLEAQAERRRRSYCEDETEIDTSSIDGGARIWEIFRALPLTVTVLNNR
ncbi:hypothetical protein ACFB49_21580 [Sphingomonas sp. DBB INV C78]